MNARLQTFRGHVARLDPAGNPRLALQEQLYIEPPGRSLARRLTASMQLAPASAQLVVGGVGSGKSTEVLLAVRNLRDAADTQAVYVDVSRKHDISTDLTGVLLVLAGLELSRLIGERDVTADVKAACLDFHDWGYAHDRFVPDDEDAYLSDGGDAPWDEMPGHVVRVEGLLRPPVPPTRPETQERIRRLQLLMGALPDPVRNVILVFDSLDRLNDMERFRSVVLDDVTALRKAGIGTVLVGPARVVYGQNRSVVDLFDQLHTQSAVDVSEDEGKSFLEGVLQRRVGDEVLPPAARSSVVRLSGGVLRDLIAIARGSLEEAFLADAELVDVQHVTTAADAFGRSMMIGLGQDDVEKLRRLRKRGTFVPTSDQDLALIESRRVLEYHGLATRYEVHPAIAPLLAALERRK